MSSAAASCITNGRLCHSATNYPQFIDTQSCLCGFVNSGAATRNGNLEQWWRCIGNANGNVGQGDHGKWFQSSLPSEELSGLAQPQNWGDNPPDTKKAYILVGPGLSKTYQELQGNDAPQLIGKDASCTGQNSTQLSTQYYASSKKGGHGSNSGSASASGSASRSSAASSTASSTSSASQTSASSSASSAAATSASASGTSASSSASSSPSPASSSEAATTSALKSWILVGMLIAPVFASLL